MPSKGAFKASDATDVTIRNATLHITDTLMRALAVRNVLFEKVQFKTPDSRIRMQVEAGAAKDIRFVDCIPPKPEGWN